MAGITRYNAPGDLATFLDSADPIYGTGSDGDVVLNGATVSGLSYSSSVYTMSSDMFFDDLTIANGFRLNPNGYRIFVKSVLTLGSNSVIGYNTGFSTSGSIAQGGSIATAVTNSLGGASATMTVTAPIAALGGSNYYKVPHQAIKGYSFSPSNTTPVFLRGGAGGVGQEGGGVVILAARYISGPLSGTGYIKAPATAPAGGGVILIVSSAASLPASVSTDVSGQTSGTVNYMQVI